MTNLLQAYPNLVILTMDQMSLYFQAMLTRMWSPVGHTPVIRTSPFDRLVSDFEHDWNESYFETGFMEHYAPPIDTAIFE